MAALPIYHLLNLCTFEHFLMVAPALDRRTRDDNRRHLLKCLHASCVRTGHEFRVLANEGKI